MAKFHRNLGYVSAQYESGGRGVDFVSNGSSWGDPGGDSYGVHQLSSAYSMGKFLQSSWGKPYAHKFSGMKPGTKTFNRKYKEVARADPDGFEYAQKAFYATTHYLPLEEYARKKGFNVLNRGIQEALFSMAVQHGGAKKIVLSASQDLKSTTSTVAQLKLLYKERSDYVNSLRTLSRKLKSNIVNKRYKNELKDAIEASYGEDDGAGELEPVEPSKTLDGDVSNDPVMHATGVFRGLLWGIRGFLRRLGGNVAKRTKTAVEDVTGVEPVFDKVTSDDPPWMVTARDLAGLREIKGKRSNKTIMSWARKIGGFVKSVYTNDDIPWCGLYVAWCMYEHHIVPGFKNVLGARNWLKFGEPTTPQYGAIMVFWRGKLAGWSGHVGFYVSEDPKYYHILGGNQSNSVNVTKIAKNRFLGARWPTGFSAYRTDKRIKKVFDGKVSRNEK